jgi:hypothetical protein
MLVRAWVRCYEVRATISNCSNNYGPHSTGRDTAVSELGRRYLKYNIRLRIIQRACRV